MKKVREKLNAKLSKNGGFTLVEMLIVVAIIAILIAVSIPMVSSSLEKARHAVDDANKRDAISLASIQYLTEEMEIGEANAKYYTVDEESHQGSLTNTQPSESLSQCTGCGGSDAAGENKYLKVWVDDTGKATAKWVDSTAP